MKEAFIRNNIYISRDSILLIVFLSLNSKNVFGSACLFPGNVRLQGASGNFPEKFTSASNHSGKTSDYGAPGNFPEKFTSGTCFFSYIGTKLVLPKTVRAEMLYMQI